ncbi:hypothetical protein Hanom_Chr05g00471781 [Helianthus anomalus]
MKVGLGGRLVVESGIRFCCCDTGISVRYPLWYHFLCGYQTDKIRTRVLIQHWYQIGKTGTRTITIRVPDR